MKKPLLILAASVLVACSDPAAISPSATDASTDVVANDSAVTDSGGDAAEVAKLSVVATFNAASYELAEGLTFHKGSAYVGFAPLGQIKKVDPDGKVTPYASVPPGYNAGYTLGLIFDAQDTLYVLQTKNDPDAGSVQPGIYKIPAGGGAATTPFASDPNMVFPNGLDFDAQGNLLVADSATGTIFKVTPTGQVTKWLQDPELSGSPACPAPLPFPIGANGIVFTPTEVFVTNTAKGSVVRVAVANGAAGAVSTLVKDCQWAGWDGLARDKDGSLLSVQNGLGGHLARITTSGVVTVLASGGLLDGPGSVVFAEPWNGTRVALVTNTAFFSVGVDGGSPSPALLQYGPLK